MYENEALCVLAKNRRAQQLYVPAIYMRHVFSVHRDEAGHSGRPKIQATR